MLLILSLAGSGSFLSGNPAGEVVRHGHVSFDRQGSTLTIQQQSSRAIVDWDSFSISLGEVTDFQQPNSQAAMLNRVTGGTRSQIDGLLRSNGNVFLQNPSGIVIGPTGSIDVGGLIATTLEIPEDEFLAGGDLNLKRITEAEVINLGEISARDGDVYLLAKEVRNEGRIEASNGRVGLAAGTEILLREKWEERISVRASSGLSKDAGVTNSGVIEATVAELKAHGGSIYGLAVKNEGRVAATSVTKSGGQIFLSAGQGGTLLSSGTLSATREGGKTGGDVSVRADEGAALIGGVVDVSGTERGGEVRIEGNSVEIVEAATIQASGDGQGGRVLVGGGREGQDPTMQNAAFTTVGDGVVVDVSAKVAGDAGEAIYFAEDTLAYHGFTLANGGMETGNGGFVELSGKKRVTFDGFVEAADVSASNGTDGHLLFDPVDIVIQDGTGGGLVDGDGKPGSDTVFDDDSIANFLESSGSLEIRTDGGDTGAGDITIEDGVEIVWTTGNDLTLRADRHIQFSGGATMESQTGNISLLAAGSIVAGGMGDGGAEFTRDVGYPSGDQVSMVSVSGDILVMGGSAGEQRDSVSLTDVMIETGGDVDIQGTSEAPDGFGVFLDRGSIQGGRVRVIGSGGEEGANVSLSQLTVSEGGEVYLQGDAITGVGLNVASPIQVVDGSATVTLDGKTLAQEADAVFLKGHDDSTGTVNLTLRSRGGSVNADSGMLTVNDLMLDNEEGSQDDFEFLGSAVSEIAGRGQLGDVMATSLSTGVKLKGIQSAGTVEVASEDAIKVIGASSASTFRLEAPQIDIDAPITASEVNLFGPAASPSSELTIFNVSAPINSSSISATAFLSPADELNIDGEFQPSLWTLTGIDSIVGVGESDALRGTDQGDAFFITGETSTFLGGATYENFERLLGGGGNDVFDFLVEAPRTIDGGEDTDF
ncbi:MAG: filamentous hemagglutinin N-terminal domain-containing protein, partial [Verrucomicrobiota bacterium]